ncbi:hypothetical protein T484DRAFT_1863193, partial [Baffinella frigidus]
VARNAISELPASALPLSLRILDASHNLLSDLAGLRGLGLLEQLNVRCNRVRRFQEGNP